MIRTKDSLNLGINISWSLTGNIIYAVSQWVFLVVMAKLGSSLMVGQFSFGLAITAPIFMFTSLQLRQIQSTDSCGDFTFEHFITLRILGLFCANVVSILIIFFSQQPNEIRLIILLAAAMKSVEALSDTIYGLWQQHERMDLVARSLIYRAVLSLLFAPTVLYATHNLAYMMVGALGAWTLTLTLYDFPRSRIYAPVRLAFSSRDIILLARLSFPLAIVTMLFSLNVNIPRYFVEQILGLSDLGYYAAISYVMLAGTTIMNAIGQSASPRLAKYFHSHDFDNFRSLLARLLWGSLVIGSTGIIFAKLFAKEILSIVYTSDYIRYSEIFFLLTIGTAISFISTMLSYVMVASRMLIVQAPIYIILTIVNVVLCKTLIPISGLVGTAYAFILFNFVQALMLVIAFIRGMQKYGGIEIVLGDIYEHPEKGSYFSGRNQR